ncbi:MAG: hypothetical protein ABSF28_07730 [Terracidiphilus sp.]
MADEIPKCPECGARDPIIMDGEESEDGILPVSFLCGHCLHGFSGHWSAIHEIFYPSKEK